MFVVNAPVNVCAFPIVVGIKSSSILPVLSVTTALREAVAELYVEVAFEAGITSVAPVDPVGVDEAVSSCVAISTRPFCV